jgi:hypothetical protein
MTGDEDAEFNIRAGSFALARTLIRCPACRVQTPVFALAVLPGHETRDDDDEAADTWSLGRQPAFLFHVGALVDAARAAIAARTTTWRPDIDAEGQEAWLNHCHRCDTVLGDSELFCEPGGFSPATAADAACIELETIDVPLAAAAAGYAPDPAYFDAIRRG